MSSKENLSLMPRDPIQNLQHFAEIIADMQSKHMNVLSPITKMDRMLPMHGLALALVPIDPDPASGDVWHDKRWGQDEVALTHPSLNRLFISAGGTWLHDLCGRVDDRSQTYVVEWRAVGQMKDPTGQPVSSDKTRRVDYRENSPETKGWSADRLNEARKFILESAESKAQNRVIRALLGVKSKYKQEQVRRPFVVVRSVPLLDMSNPIVVEMAARFALGGAEALYGSPRQEAVRQIDTVDSTKVVPEIPAHLANDTDDEPEKPPAAAAPVSAFSVEEKPFDFATADEGAQLRALAEMMKQKGFPVSNLNKPLPEFTETERKDLFTYLEKRPNAVEQGAFKL